MIACTEYISFYTIVTNYNGPLAVDIVRINDATHLEVAKCRANRYHSRIWSWGAVYTTDGISQVRVDMSSIWMRKRGLNTKTFASTNTSYNKAKNVFWRANWTHPSMSIVVIYKLQMTYLRLEFICRLHGCIEEVWVLRLLISPMYHTITSFKCALMRHLLIWLWLSSVVIYEVHTTLPRLELICCPDSFIEEICWLQLVHSRINCTTQALNVSWRGHRIWPKWSTIVIVRSLLDNFFAVDDISFTWIYRCGRVTSTC